MSSDAAAFPSPPDFALWDNASRPRSVGAMPASGRPVGLAPHQIGNNQSSPASQPPIFPNIKDLQDEAAALDVNENTSLSVLLERAQVAINQARELSDSDQLDRAYVQYLRASEITINIIPHHPDYRVTASQRPAWLKRFADLMMAVRTKQGTMDDIKQQIVENNLMTNIQPVGSSQSHPTRPKSEILGTFPLSDSAQMPASSHHQTDLELQAKRHRFSSPPTDALAQRFAKLKMSPPDSTTLGPAPNGTNSILQAAPQDLSAQPAAQAPPQTSALSSPTRRPLGPRGPRNMGSPHGVPTLPPKVPLNTSLPRAPDPAYSPIWSVPSQGPSNPPRTSTESSRPVNPRYSQLANSPHGSPSRDGFDDNPYRSRTPNGVHQAKEIRSSSADLPHSTTITPTDLINYLRKYNILLIDVRSRDQYDTGHIYASSIICVEPVVLKENVSAEELEERLVVSPEYEQALFERRNEFDMVVYYDQKTASTSYLAGSPVGTSAPHLRALYDTLYEFNAYKPLKDGRPPALLLGGLDAWIELIGQQSLVTSSTAAVMGSLQAKRPLRRPGRPLGRVPTMVSANSSLEVRKRRLREYKPLNPQELTEWMEKSKTEEIDASTYIEEDEEALAEEPAEEEEVPASPFVQNYEDFLRRFPEPGAIQQSMVAPHIRPAGTSAPNYAAPVPVAPSRPPPAVPRPSYSGVSDGRHIQPTLERQSSATKTALYTPLSMLSRLKLPRTGLTNFGVTCYMNSTLQCLSATLLLSKFFIDNRFRYYVQKNWKGSQGVMPGLFANLIRSLWKNDVEVIMPTSFRNFCGRLNQEWAIDRQQDAKEFFDFVVDCLHEDLNINWQRNQLRPLTFEEEMQRERMPVPKVSKIEWDRYCHREESFISSLFAGQHASRLRCTTCKRTSTTYEAFYSISVEIPPSGTGDIYQCLRSYCQEEMLSGDEVWKCPYCKCERVATKQIIITRAPQILVIHFKRFSASKTQSARKIHTPIEFPLHGLRMDDFVFSQPTPTPLPNGHSAVAPSGTTIATAPPFTYDAYGVLRHIGSSMGSGHYISLVRDAQRQCWRKFDDERVTDFNPRDLRPKERLQNEQAYIVFYERVPAK
ncbi:putative ubiquitin C-terminal hydrolase [Aspergillus homomorphus CBS 101889]|uniref:Ubiquitin C-terminal hydrolase n=1 Tax=Aspergillus homomorphus (strain CBS 101889) TaxID=1450537 RepID=A0A395I7T0_ASPHC|nr:ubiquitin C-terminal hydrolase [Aspergillus homomorphus CBS 101889]RAL16280.1 ubiquitin C-terminal hydrolase [Aspergillus homomorphus CBS 101889]